MSRVFYRGLGLKSVHDETAVLFVQSGKLAYLDTPKHNYFSIIIANKNSLNSGFTIFFINRFGAKLVINRRGQVKLRGQSLRFAIAMRGFVHCPFQTVNFNLEPLKLNGRFSVNCWITKRTINAKFALFTLDAFFLSIGGGGSSLFILKIAL